MAWHGMAYGGIRVSLIACLYIVHRAANRVLERANEGDRVCLALGEAADAGSEDEAKEAGACRRRGANRRLPMFGAHRVI